MATDPTTAELHARLDALGKRIEEHRHQSAAETGAPYADASWKDIVSTHGKLVQEIAQERKSPDAVDRIRADVEALSLSFDAWIKRVDANFSKKG